MKIDEHRGALRKASRVRNMFLALLIPVGIAACFLGIAAGAQTSAPGAAPPASKAPAKAPAGARGASTAAGPKVDANLAQLMRGILFPSSNVVFAAQDDLSKFVPAADPSASPNPLTSSYGGWTAVENASLAMAEASKLIVMPGRVCSNGRPVPVQRADWQKYAQGLRKAGLDAYKAAQTKSTDAMVDAAGEVTDACAACHNVYREKKGGIPDRCLP